MTTPANPHDLTTWLRAQVDEDEATTRELLYWAQQTILTLQDSKLLGKHIPGWHDWPKVERMCRVRLAEVDAKRRILDECAYWAEKVKSGDPYPALADRYEVAMSVLRPLALPYADREGFREEWRT